MYAPQRVCTHARITLDRVARARVYPSATKDVNSICGHFDLFISDVILCGRKLPNSIIFHHFQPFSFIRMHFRLSATVLLARVYYTRSRITYGSKDITSLVVSNTNIKL